MRRSIAAIGSLIVIAAMVVPAGTVSAAEFPSVQELFDPSNIDYPDIGMKDIFGYAEDLFTDPDAFSSVMSLSGFVDFLKETFTDTTGSFDITSIPAAVMIICIVVIIMCILSAILGKRRGDMMQ